MRPFILLPMLSLALTAALADERPFIDEPEPPVPKSVKPAKEWEEDRVRLPPWPRDQDLVEIPLDDPDARFHYSLDAKNLATGSDGVVRYTLVTESRSGTRNLSFEGIRCTPRGALRVYAFGSQGSFSRIEPKQDWRPIDDRSTRSVHRELWRHYLCVPRLLQPLPKQKQLRRLRSGRVPSVDNTGFLSN